MKRATLATFIVPLAVALVVPDVARAMCGCMIAPRPRVGETKTAKIINKTSKVILARDGDTTVLTMANDFEGAPVDFGLVVPVPTVIKREDVKIVQDQVFAELEAITAPRVVEMFEPDPCLANRGRLGGAGDGMAAPSAEKATTAARPRASDYGVKVESHFFAGEYEIAVLSGKDGGGLIKWLQLFDYDVPDDAQRVLESYIKQNMMFFLARVHVKEMGNARRTLRPIQVRYTTPKLMLPIRLGMVNASGPQELLVHVLTPGGRAEMTNYRAVKMPTGSVIPHFAKDAWSEVYGAMFDEQTKREDMRVVFVEHAQAIGPTTTTKKAGAFWQDAKAQVFVTRLHFKYREATFPEDLVLQITNDGAPFVVLHTAMKPASSSCPDPGAPQRRYQEQQTLANLTGWSIEKVMERAGGKVGSTKDKWYERIWND